MPRRPPPRAEDAEAAARFEARVAAEDKVEPNDWMPEAYRRTLTRQISQHAHSEIVGMLPEGNWITRAPACRRKAALLAKVQDEGGHGLYLYAAAETLGTSREELNDSSVGQRQVQLDLQLPDAHLGGHRRDRLAGGRRGDHEPDPALPDLLRPYARAMVRICKEESFHQRQGYEIMLTLCRGTPEQKAMAQDALDRWWWPSLMMFGPPDAAAQHTDTSMRWKIKRFTNDELRQQFVDATVPQGHHLGLTFPDPSCASNEATGHWEFGEIDWAEFKAGSRRQRPRATGQRLRTRRQAHESGAWVREAPSPTPPSAARARPGRRPHPSSPRSEPAAMTEAAMPLWEVFIRPRRPVPPPRRQRPRPGRRRWRCSPRATPTPAAARAFRSGSCPRRPSPPATRPTRTACSSRPRARPTGTRPSTRCRTKSGTCEGPAP
jgi:ring-1,2-phenylacetyl-CoA epoxidase subunit PaaA